MTKFNNPQGALKRAGAIAMLLAVAACAATTEPPAEATAGLDADRAERFARLLQNCDRLRRTDNLVLATGVCRRAHEVAPDDAAPLIRLGALHAQMGDHRQAAESYRGAIDRDVALVEPRIGLGKSLIALQQYEPALHQLQIAREREPGNPRVLSAIGVIRDLEGDHVTAQAMYRAGLEAAPQDVALRNNLALSLTLSGANGEAIAILREIVAGPGSNPTSRQNLALAHVRNGDTEIAEAIDRIDRVTEVPVAAAVPELDAVQMAPAAGAAVEPSRPPIPTRAKRRPFAMPASPRASEMDDDSDAVTADKTDSAPVLRRSAANQRAFAVQLAAYRRADQAETGWRRLKGGAKELLGDVDRRVERIDHGGKRGVFFRLRVGQFDSKGAADRFCASLKNRAIDCFVTEG